VFESQYRQLYEGVNYRLRTFFGGRFAVRCRPISIVILLTELCNARCVHCDIWKNKGRETGPTFEQWKQVLSELRSWLGPVHVCFSGGEALLKLYTIDLVAYAREIGLFIEILTHGYWKDQTKIEKLAVARPSRVTVSLDGFGATHSRVRGKEDFFEVTRTSIDTLLRVREAAKLDYEIRLKTVVMSHNLDDLSRIAEFATRDGMHVFYQPIEQNYNTSEDPLWYKKTDNWPRDPERAVNAVESLIRLKRRGLHIDNSFAQLQAMIPYFRHPESLRVLTQAHMAHEKVPSCAALTTLQFQANGDVFVCTATDSVGNVLRDPIRKIWESRPHLWENGCCRATRCVVEEREAAMPITFISGLADTKKERR
jgi:MoaA/NifB/PqqE/SkfB family radical SAM enzyme